MSRSLKNWSTIDVRPSETDVPWKKSMGQACPHGIEFFMVDGTHVRNTYDSDWIQGGHGWRYKFCPRSEIWIDSTMPEAELPFVMLHECYEVQLMAKEGLDYDRAHDRAKRIENKFRRDHFGDTRPRR
jgi:hypothetical protein